MSPGPDAIPADALRAFAAAVVAARRNPGAEVVVRLRADPRGIVRTRVDILGVTPEAVVGLDGGATIERTDKT